MKGIPQGRYTKEFRQEAVKLIIEEGLSWGEAARRLSLPAFRQFFCFGCSQIAFRIYDEDSPPLTVQGEDVWA